MNRSQVHASPLFAGPHVRPLGSGRALVVPLGEPHDVVSWAIVNGGRRHAEHVVWREVRIAELGPRVDADRLMRSTLAELGLPDAVGLLTARDIRTFEEEIVERRGVRARCIATVGLGNVLAAGDPAVTASEPKTTIGTINLVCTVSVGLAEEALLEASALATEAKAAAMMTSGCHSPLSGRLATGTGTDCVVIGAPVRERGERFAGKHTPCGSAIGGSVFGAVERGVARWLRENRAR